MRNYLVLLSFLFLQSCNFLEEKILSIEVFENQKIYFNQEKAHQDSEILIRDNGRLVFKKITIPSFKRNVATLIEVELISAGDPWDKSGSVFLLDTHPDSCILYKSDEDAEEDSVDNGGRSIIKNKM